MREGFKSIFGRVCLRDDHSVILSQGTQGSMLRLCVRLGVIVFTLLNTPHCYVKYSHNKHLDTQ